MGYRELGSFKDLVNHVLIFRLVACKQLDIRLLIAFFVIQTFQSGHSKSGLDGIGTAAGLDACHFFELAQFQALPAAIFHFAHQGHFANLEDQDISIALFGLVIERLNIREPLAFQQCPDIFFYQLAFQRSPDAACQLAQNLLRTHGLVPLDLDIENGPFWQFGTGRRAFGCGLGTCQRLSTKHGNRGHNTRGHDLARADGSISIDFMHSIQPHGHPFPRAILPLTGDRLSKAKHTGQSSTRPAV